MKGWDDEQAQDRTENDSHPEADQEGMNAFIMKDERD